MDGIHCNGSIKIYTRHSSWHKKDKESNTYNPGETIFDCLDQSDEAFTLSNANNYFDLWMQQCANEFWWDIRLQIKIMVGLFKKHQNRNLKSGCNDIF